MARTIENQQGELKNKVDDIPNNIEAQVKTQMEKCDAIHELEKNIETSKREIQAIKDMSHIFQELGEEGNIDDVKCLSKSLDCPTNSRILETFHAHS